LRDYAGQGFADFKKALSDVAVENLSPITQKMGALKDDRAYLQNVLDSGAEKAADMAAPIIAEVKTLTGFVAPKR
jgi:tryptophanyl-tRNA synthetase